MRYLHRPYLTLFLVITFACTPTPDIQEIAISVSSPMTRFLVRDSSTFEIWEEISADRKNTYHGKYIMSGDTALLDYSWNDSKIIGRKLLFAREGIFALETGRLLKYIYTNRYRKIPFKHAYQFKPREEQNITINKILGKWRDFNGQEDLTITHQYLKREDKYFNHTDSFNITLLNKSPWFLNHSEEIPTLYRTHPTLTDTTYHQILYVNDSSLFMAFIYHDPCRHFDYTSFKRIK